jgi:hypothetical protein
MLAGARASGPNRGSTLEQQQSQQNRCERSHGDCGSNAEIVHASRITEKANGLDVANCPATRFADTNSDLRSTLLCQKGTLKPHSASGR